MKNLLIVCVLAVGFTPNVHAEKLTRGGVTLNHGESKVFDDPELMTDIRGYQGFLAMTAGEFIKCQERNHYRSNTGRAAYYNCSEAAARARYACRILVKDFKGTGEILSLIRTDDAYLHHLGDDGGLYYDYYQGVVHNYCDYGFLQVACDNYNYYPMEIGRVVCTME